LFPLLGLVAPEILKKIKSFGNNVGVIVLNELIGFSQRQFTMTISKLPDGTMVVSIDDISEKQQAMLERSVMQGRFEIASDVLHDIGNAIVGIGSNLTRMRRSLDQHNNDNLAKLAGFFSVQQALIAGALGDVKAAAVVNMLNSMVETQKAQRDEIIQSISEQTNIIAHVQDILHIQRQYVNGQSAQDRRQINLRGVIEDCLSMQHASMEKRGISVTTDVPDQVPSIIGDRTRLMQVILNILKNSMEAIDMTGTEKDISVRLIVADGLLTLQIRDNGCGFDEATGQRIFDRGFTTKSSGTGLGLHNCRSIIQSHSGEISISSGGRGKGSLTTISFK
ncbi:MAG: HAMP domain-containing histidine kinase, partial [Bacteroidetes bacterium]|nr:HAMP domain-containing histidine kinase [Bacteroidota bacterium]